MKFEKQKLKKCKNCIYYTKRGNLHWCVEYGIRKYGFDLISPLKLICFRKEVEKNE